MGALGRLRAAAVEVLADVCRFWADFTDMLISNDVKIKLCNNANGTNTITNRRTIETLECF